MTPEILYEDNHLLVVVKPANLPVMADDSGDPDLQSLLKAFLKERDGKPGQVFLALVHRLDRPVGGVMVFAKTSKAASRLSAQIRERTTGKEYLTVLRGTPSPEQHGLEDFLLKDERTRTSRVVPAGTPGAKLAVLDYRVLQSLPGVSLVWVRIHTGRPHQIRVQFASRGTPILGDWRYGGVSEPAGTQGDIALWCLAMTVDHPTRGERMRFAARPPGVPPWTDFAAGVLLETAGGPQGSPRHPGAAGGV